MKKYSYALVAMLITSTFLVLTGCMKDVKKEETIEKSAQPAAEENGSKTKKEKALDKVKEEKIEEQLIKESALSSQPKSKDEELLSQSSSQAQSSAAKSDEWFSIIYFDFDSSTVRDDMKLSLDSNTSWLRKRADVKVQLQGHADERGTNEYNIALAERRTQTIKKYLVDSGINEANLSTISYGEEKPIENGHTEDAWAKNRRVEFQTLNK